MDAKILSPHEVLTVNPKQSEDDGLEHAYLDLVLQFNSVIRQKFKKVRLDNSGIPEESTYNVVLRFNESSGVNITASGYHQLAQRLGVALKTQGWEAENVSISGNEFCLQVRCHKPDPARYDCTRCGAYMSECWCQ